MPIPPYTPRSAFNAGVMTFTPDNLPQNDAQVKRAQRLLSRRLVVYINREISDFATGLYSMDLRLGIQKALDYFFTAAYDSTLARCKESFGELATISRGDGAA